MSNPSAVVLHFKWIEIKTAKIPNTVLIRYINRDRKQEKDDCGVQYWVCGLCLGFWFLTFKMGINGENFPPQLNGAFMSVHI